jgi:hypothetical protein
MFGNREASHRDESDLATGPSDVEYSAGNSGISEKEKGSTGCTR